MKNFSDRGSPADRDVDRRQQEHGCSFAGLGSFLLGERELVSVRFFWTSKEKVDQTNLKLSLRHDEVTRRNFFNTP